MKLFDTHCHFDFDVFGDDLSQQIALAKQHHVERFLIPSISPDNWQRIIQLSDQHPSIYFALGFHPLFLTQQWPFYSTLKQALEVRHEKCVAVGECGLDFAIKVPQALQEEALIAQCNLANEFELPIILHSRKAHNRLLQLVKRHKAPKGGVLHGFSGSYQQAMEWVKQGFKIGVGGTITYPRANKTIKAIQQLSLDCLVLETDAPDMPLNGFQGQPNHPKRLSLVLESLAEIHKKEKQTIASYLWDNSNSVFSLCE